MADRPTDRELQILRVLWQLGPSTVRAVHEALKAHGQVGYTTALKMLQVMHDKGLVTRDASRRPHVFTAHDPPEKVQRSLVSHLMERAFGGSATDLVMRALSDRPTSRAELDAIRDLLDKIESEQDS
jgi:BlaI family transcriptional regulator, penicillinase repressor